MKNWIIKNGSLYLAGLWRNFTDLAYPIAEELNDSFAKVSYGSKYGCVNVEGKTIVGCKYDVIFHLKLADNDLIFCGRDGEIFYGKPEFCSSNTIYGFNFQILNGQKSHIFSNIFSNLNYIYTGKYDLYDSDGNLLIGGFDDLIFNEENKIYCLLFGRLWNLHYREHKYRYNDWKIGKWCILNDEFVIPFGDVDFSRNVRYTCGCYYYGYKFKGEVIKSHIMETLKMGDSYYPKSIVSDFRWTNIESFNKDYILAVDFPNEFMFNEIRHIINNEIFVVKGNNQYKINIETKSISHSNKGTEYPWEKKKYDYSDDSSDINIWDALDGEPEALCNID